MSQKKKKNEQKKKKDVTRTLRRKTMTPTAEEKRKSIHTRKTREFSRMRIAYLRQTSFNGKIAFLYVRVPTHFVYFCVLCVLARARAFFKKVWRFTWKSFLFFSSVSFLGMFENDQTHEKLPSGIQPFLMSTQEMRMRNVFILLSYVYGCMYVVVRKMDDGLLASVVVYNFISIYYHLHLNL